MNFIPQLRKVFDVDDRESIFPNSIPVEFTQSITH